MRRRRQGFTLVETAVAAALFIAVIGLALAIFYQSSPSEVRLSQKVGLQSQARKAYFTMTEELKLGTEILQPAINGTTPFILFTNVTYEVVGYYVRKSAKDPSKRELCRVNFNAKDPQPEVLSDAVTELKFTRKGRREVAVRFGFRESETNTLQLVNSITLRNTLNAL